MAVVRVSILDQILTVSFRELPNHMIDFPPSRAAGLKRLQAFAPRSGEAYARSRNTDFGPDQPNAVSRLSPYLRYRLISEHETIDAVFEHHNFNAAEKFIQEVLWRTYFKGWLEMRPDVWRRFLIERDEALDKFHDKRAIVDAESGLTGIDGFDHWARELVETGYLHNHARMWFASIWIFTLRLPWVLGADFFLRHLIDADPASNTLSWRWVAGLQTPGKTYLATADNIARFSNGRFTPKGLSREAKALTEQPLPSSIAIPAQNSFDANAPSLLLVTHEDFLPEILLPKSGHVVSIICVHDDRLLWGDKARAFVRHAAVDCAARLEKHFKCPTTFLDSLDGISLRDAARATGVSQILTADAPVGPIADSLHDLTLVLAKDDIVLVQIRRSWDSTFWPDAKRGFFSFKETVVSRLESLGMMKNEKHQLSFFDHTK